MKFIDSIDSNCIPFTGMRLLLVMVIMVWACGALAQQQYNYTTEGYACNGRDRACDTYALYRTFQANESLAKVASYFNTTPAIVANLSGLETNATAGLPMGQALYIPLECRCRSSTSQMQVPHTLVLGDSYFKLAATIYGGLTTYEAMITANPTIDVYYLTVDDTVWVPIFCACPTVQQIANGVNYLLTYGVDTGETLDFISANFGITAEEVSAANQLPVDTIPENTTTVLVPLQMLPPLAAMKFPHVMPPSSSGRRSKVEIIAWTIAGAVAVILLAVGLLLRRGGFAKKEGERRNGFSLVDPNLALRMFTYKELRKATKSFSRNELLGSGGFGAVYKGTLPSGAVVAVKWMRRESKHSEESFQAEAASLSQIRHRNLVQLRGWCSEENLLLAHDYMCNGSLDEWLYRRKVVEALPLTLRHSVLAGVATALSYLHGECAQCVLHRDIKSSNVLLDGEMNAYLGDFGLARLIDHQKMEKTTMMAGTLGYMAPEMPHTGKATKKTDVFSFGVLMLEVMCGSRPLDATAIERGDGVLVDRVWRAHEAGNIVQAADSRLGMFPPSAANSSSSGESEGFSNVITSNPSTIQGSARAARKRIVNLLQLGLLCCNPNPEDRPSMRLVSQLLQSEENEEITMPPLPACKPHALYSELGFSQLVNASDPWSNDVIVQDAGLGSGHHSTPPPARAGMLTSFAAPDSLVSSGR